MEPGRLIDQLVEPREGCIRTREIPCNDTEEYLSFTLYEEIIYRRE